MAARENTFSTVKLVKEGILKLKCRGSDGLLCWRAKRCRLVQPSAVQLADVDTSGDMSWQTVPLEGARCALAWSSVPTLGGCGFDLLWTSGRGWSLLAEDAKSCSAWVADINAVANSAYQQQYIDQQAIQQHRHPGSSSGSINAYSQSKRAEDDNRSTSYVKQIDQQPQHTWTTPQPRPQSYPSHSEHTPRTHQLSQEQRRGNAEVGHTSSNVEYGTNTYISSTLGFSYPRSTGHGPPQPPWGRNTETVIHHEPPIHIQQQTVGRDSQQYDTNSFIRVSQEEQSWTVPSEKHSFVPPTPPTVLLQYAPTVERSNIANDTTVDVAVDDRQGRERRQMGANNTVVGDMRTQGSIENIRQSNVQRDVHKMDVDNSSSSRGSISREQMQQERETFQEIPKEPSREQHQQRTQTAQVPENPIIAKEDARIEYARRNSQEVSQIFPATSSSRNSRTASEDEHEHAYVDGSVSGAGSIASVPDVRGESPRISIPPAIPTPPTAARLLRSVATPDTNSFIEKNTVVKTTSSQNIDGDSKVSANELAAMELSNRRMSNLTAASRRRAEQLELTLNKVSEEAKTANSMIEELNSKIEVLTRENEELQFKLKLNAEDSESDVRHRIEEVRRGAEIEASSVALEHERVLENMRRQIVAAGVEGEERGRAAAGFDASLSLMKAREDLGNIRKEIEAKAQADVQAEREAMRQDLDKLQKLHRQRVSQLEAMIMEEGAALAEARREVAALNTARAADASEFQRVREEERCTAEQQLKELTTIQRAVKQAISNEEASLQRESLVRSELLRLQEARRLERAESAEAVRKAKAAVQAYARDAEKHKETFQQQKLLQRALEISRQEVALVEEDRRRLVSDRTVLETNLDRLSRLVYGTTQQHTHNSGHNNHINVENTHSSKLTSEIKHPAGVPPSDNTKNIIRAVSSAKKPHVSNTHVHSKTENSSSHLHRPVTATIANNKVSNNKVVGSSRIVYSSSTPPSKQPAPPFLRSGERSSRKVPSARKTPQTDRIAPQRARSIPPKGPRISSSAPQTPSGRPPTPSGRLRSVSPGFATGRGQTPRKS